MFSRMKMVMFVRILYSNIRKKTLKCHPKFVFESELFEPTNWTERGIGKSEPPWSLKPHDSVEEFLLSKICIILPSSISESRKMWLERLLYANFLYWAKEHWQPTQHLTKNYLVKLYFAINSVTPISTFKHASFVHMKYFGF